MEWKWRRRDDAKVLVGIVPDVATERIGVQIIRAFRGRDVFRSGFEDELRSGPNSVVRRKGSDQRSAVLVRRAKREFAQSRIRN